jgi:alanyl-tRNA synthetase
MKVLLSSQSGDLLSGAKEVNGVPVLAQEVQAESPKELRDFADRIKERIPSSIIVLGAKNEGKTMLLCMVTKDLVGKYKAGDLMHRLSEMVGGKGGGRPDMAQGGGLNPDKLKTALESVYGLIG